MPSSAAPGVAPALGLQQLSKTHEPAGQFPNRHVPGAREYYPLTEPSVGTALSSVEWPSNKTLPKLFTPINIRNVSIKNRIWVSPMCQYSSPNGLATDWHLVHIGQFAIRGAGLISMEATAVTPEGRISPEDNGIWSDEHIPNLKRITDFVHAQGGVIGVQLAHAGRKASTRSPWASVDLKRKNRDPTGSDVATVEEGGWPDNVWAPSAIPFNDVYPNPKALTKGGIARIQDAFEAAVVRAKKADFDFIEIHGAHGYLIHEFLSPLSNRRTDEYGGSLENRLRFVLEIAKRARKAWGEEKPIFLRLSGTDWAEGPEKDASGIWKQWGVEQSSQLARRAAAEAGIDLIDVSSGGNWVAQKIPVKPSYQVPLAESIKNANPNILVTAVGLITDAHQAEDIVKDKANGGKGLDAVWLAREFLRNADFTLKAAEELGVVVRSVVQYERAWSRFYSTQKNKL